MTHAYAVSDKIHDEILEKFRRLHNDYLTKGKADWNTAQITQQKAAELVCEFLPKDVTKYFRPIFNLHPDN